MTFFKKIFRSKSNQSKSRKLEKFDALNKSDRSIISLISAVYSEDSRSRNSLPSISNSSSNSSRESSPVFIKSKNPEDSKSILHWDQANNLKASSLKNVKFGPEILSNPDLIGQKWYTRQNVYEVKRILFNKYRINGSNGTFVIRSEVQNEKYSLYLSFIYNSRIRHHKILQKDQRGKYLYCLENVSVLSFPSIPALVQFYKLNSTPPLPCTLKE